MIVLVLSVLAVGLTVALPADTINRDLKTSDTSYVVSYPAAYYSSPPVAPAAAVPAYTLPTVYVR